MSDYNDGGTAFPNSVPTDFQWADTGMSLRDYFAAKALVGLLSGNPDADCGPDGYAKDAYMFADAMLRAGDKS